MATKRKGILLQKERIMIITSTISMLAIPAWVFFFGWTIRTDEWNFTLLEYIEFFQMYWEKHSQFLPYQRTIARAFFTWLIPQTPKDFPLCNSSEREIKKTESIFWSWFIQGHPCSNSQEFCKGFNYENDAGFTEETAEYILTQINLDKSNIFAGRGIEREGERKNGSIPSLRDMCMDVVSKNWGNNLEATGIPDPILNEIKKHIRRSKEKELEQEEYNVKIDALRNMLRYIWWSHIWPTHHRFTWGKTWDNTCDPYDYSSMTFVISAILDGSTYPLMDDKDYIKRLETVNAKRRRLNILN